MNRTQLPPIQRTFTFGEIKLKIVKNKTSINPFCPCGDVDHVACINNWMQFADLADHYICSADALVIVALEDHTLLDVHVQPVCFLYRHGIELLLKDMAWKSHYLVTGTKIFAQKNWEKLGTHRLGVIWSEAKSAAKTVLGADFPLDSTKVNEVQSFLAQIEEHDPDACSFRYPISKKKCRTHPQLINVNLVDLRTKAHNTFDQITVIQEMIDYCLSSE